MRRLLDGARRGGEEAGFTLVETLLTLLILSIVMTVAFNFLDRSSILTYRADAHSRAEDEVQRVLRTVTENVRGAAPIGNACTTATDSESPPFIAGYDNCTQFTVLRTSTGIDSCARTEFVYGIVGSSAPRQLVERRREYTGTTTSCTAGPLGFRRLLLSDVMNDTTLEPLFTYYAGDGTKIATSSAAAVVKAATVKVTIVARYRKGAPNLTISSSAALRNNISR
jgi:prepilin-type N-terminal cleavage/methylation domain-containing protein